MHHLENAAAREAWPSCVDTVLSCISTIQHLENAAAREARPSCVDQYRDGTTIRHKTDVKPWKQAAPPPSKRQNKVGRMQWDGFWQKNGVKRPDTGRDMTDSWIGSAEMHFSAKNARKTMKTSRATPIQTAKQGRPHALRWFLTQERGQTAWYRPRYAKLMILNDGTMKKMGDKPKPQKSSYANNHASPTKHHKHHLPQFRTFRQSN